MPDPAERIVNLALFLAACRTPVSAERIRLEVYGYPDDQDEPAFLRMFERDKDEMRATGLFVSSTPDGTYFLDGSRSFCEEFTLSAEEELVLRAAGSALLEDPSFPFADDLRRALVKIASATDSPLPVSSIVADEHSGLQGEAVALLASASASGKRTAFEYTNASGTQRRHTIEPYGLFLREGRWYSVGRDIDLDEVRVYAITRMRGLTADTARPKTPDFRIPEDFDVRVFVGLPFQYGPADPFEITVRFDASIAWRADTLTGGSGTLEHLDDGVRWSVEARDEDAALRWAIGHGPGIEIEAPTGLARRMHESIRQVAVAHG